MLSPAVVQRIISRTVQCILSVWFEWAKLTSTCIRVAKKIFCKCNTSWFESLTVTVAPK